MSDVCVVTGGVSGMGLSAALQMPKDRCACRWRQHKRKELQKIITKIEKRYHNGKATASW